MSMVPAKNSSSGFSRTTGRAGVAIVLAALVVYHNSLSCPFVFDDWPAITQNLTIRHFRSALSPPHNGSGVDGRPLINLSFAVNYALGGLQVRGYHATNLAIHILAGLTLFGIVRRTLQQPVLQKRFGEAVLPLALTVALLWTVHPLLTESVTSVIQRTESLMGLFYLLTLYCFIRGTEAARTPNAESPTTNAELPTTERRRLSGYSANLWMLASVGACLLGMATKEVMVSAPLIVLLYDRTFLAGTFREAWRRRGGWYLGLFGTWLVLGFMLVCMGGSRGQAAGFGLNVTPWDYALTQCRAIVLYLGLAGWPHPLVFDYGTNVVKDAAAVVPQALVLTLLVAGTIFLLRYQPVLGFVGVWFFAILAPSSSVVPLVGQTMAEHRMYLPLAAVMALVVLGLYAWIGPRSLIIFAAAVVGLGWLTIQRNKDYRSDLAIWSDTVAKCPESARAHYNLGAALAGVGRVPEAVSEYEEALQIQPKYPGAHNNLGCILANIPGRLPEAIGHFEAAFRFAPDYAMAHNNFGIVLYKNGRIPEAIAQFKEAVRIDPDDAQAHHDLGVALDKAGRIREAIFQLEEVVRINPDDAEAHGNLGIALDRAGQMPEALAQFEEAVRIDPNSAAAHKNLGIALGKVGRISEAMAECKEVLRINPDSGDARAFLKKLQKAEQ